MLQQQFISKKRSYFFATLAVLGWGLSTTFIEFGLSYIRPQVFLAIRFSLAVFLTTPFMLSRKGEVLNLFKSKGVLYIAGFETIGLATQYFAQQSVSAGLSALLSMMFIIILPYLSLVFLSEKFHIYHVLSIILGFVGVFLIVSDGNLSNLGSGDTFGIIVLLITATAYAFYQLATSKYTRFENPDVDSLSLFYVVMVFISVLSFFSAVFFEFDGFLSIQIDAWLWIGLLALFSTIIAFTSYFEASKGIQANTLSILLVTQAIVPFIVDIFLLHKIYSMWTYIGGSIIVIAMIVVSFSPNEKIKLRPPSSN